MAGDVPARAPGVPAPRARAPSPLVGLHHRDERRAGRAAAANIPSDALAAEAAGNGGAVELRRDAFRELEHLTGELPPTERAAVVLRYGYDLPYADIASALGSSEDAARAAASSGVRRLRASLTSERRSLDRHA